MILVVCGPDDDVGFAAPIAQIAAAPRRCS